MNVAVDRSFERDTDKISDKKLLLRVAACIDEAKAAASPSEIKNLKKLKGFRYHYRIRIGEYRAGVTVKGVEIKFIRFLHRKDVYRYFP